MKKITRENYIKVLIILIVLVVLSFFIKFNNSEKPIPQSMIPSIPKQESYKDLNRQAESVRVTDQNSYFLESDRLINSL